MSTVRRKVWIDHVKFLACILVVFGHFFQSMTKSGIIQDTAFWQWFDRYIYCFHVPLFFICSGYLYEYKAKEKLYEKRSSKIANKLIALGIPYLFFSLITWILKNRFSDATNSDNRGLAETLLLHPASPYWYLYILFFFFLLVRVFTEKDSIYTKIIITVAVVLRVLSILGFFDTIYVLYQAANNLVWFTAGMFFSMIKGDAALKKCKVNRLVYLLPVAGLLLSFVHATNGMADKLLRFVIGILMCCGVVGISILRSKIEFENRFERFSKEMLLPVFLMHTIFAAGGRSILFKIGVRSVPIHSIVGLAVSFLLPIAAMIVMHRIPVLEFLVYPERLLKRKEK